MDLAEGDVVDAGPAPPDGDGEGSGVVTPDAADEAETRPTSPADEPEPVPLRHHTYLEKQYLFREDRGPAPTDNRPALPEARFLAARSEKKLKGEVALVCAHHPADPPSMYTDSDAKPRIVSVSTVVGDRYESAEPMVKFVRVSDGEREASCAGAGVPGYQDGVGSSALFRQPHGLAVARVARQARPFALADQRRSDPRGRIGILVLTGAWGKGGKAGKFEAKWGGIYAARLIRALAAARLNESDEGRADAWSDKPRLEC